MWSASKSSDSTAGMNREVLANKRLAALGVGVGGGAKTGAGSSASNIQNV